jgi:hypothetical protein
MDSWRDTAVIPCEDGDRQSCRRSGFSPDQLSYERACGQKQLDRAIVLPLMLDEMGIETNVDMLSKVIYMVARVGVGQVLRPPRHRAGARSCSPPARRHRLIYYAKAADR